MADTKLSFMRYEKVNAVMQADPRLKKLLSKPNQWIGKQNQTGEHFSKEVVDVTMAIDAAGMDAYAMKPHQILHFATDMLVLKLTPPVVAKKPAPEPEPEVAPKPQTKPKSAAKSTTPKLKAEPKPERKTKAKPTPKADEPEPYVDPEPEPEPENEPEPAPVNRVATREKPTEVGKTREAAVTAPAATGVQRKPTVLYIRRNIPWVPGVAGISNLYAALTLLQPYAERDPEAREFCDELNTLIDKLHSKTVLPNCAQEDAKPS